MPRIGHLPLQKLRPVHLNRMYRDLPESGSLRGGGLAPRTVRYIHAICRKALNDAVKWDLLEANPALRAEPPEANRPVVRVWSPSELRAFLAHVESDRFFGAWLMAATTGMRRGEVLGLRWSDVALQPEVGEPRLTVSHTLVAVGGEVLASTPKTVRGERTIPISGRLRDELMGWKALQRSERKHGGQAWAENAMDFPDLVWRVENGRCVHPDRFTVWFRRHVKAAGLPRIWLHDLRHGWASYALEANVDARIVTQQLGHSSVAFNAETYAHVVETSQRNAADRVVALIEGTG